jgi:hypothetical protein
MNMSDEYLSLKWGTLKGWNVTGNEAAIAALRRYHAEPTSMSAMAANDTPTQKQAICNLIDAINGPIDNDWTGEQMTKDEAKAYVMGYQR